MNQTRAVLLERGIVVAKGKRKLAEALGALTNEPGGAGLSPRVVALIADARAQWEELDRRIAAFDVEFVSWAKENEVARRLTTSPASARSPPRRWSQRSAKRKASIAVATSRPGSVLFPAVHDRGKPKLPGISKRGTNIFASC